MASKQPYFDVTVETNLEQILVYEQGLTLGETLAVVKKHHEYKEGTLEIILGLMRGSMSLEIKKDTYSKLITIEHGKEKDV